MDEIFAYVDTDCEKRKKMGRTKNKEQGVLNYEVYTLINILPSTFLAPCSLFCIPYSLSSHSHSIRFIRSAVSFSLLTIHLSFSEAVSEIDV